MILSEMEVDLIDLFVISSEEAIWEQSFLQSKKWNVNIYCVFPHTYLRLRVKLINQSIY